jgi:hypothetical protein
VSPIFDLRFTRLERKIAAPKSKNSQCLSQLVDAVADGLTNLQELFAGTDPRISSSALRITETSRNATDVSFTFSSVAGRIYRIETRDDLVSPNWLLFQDTIVATGASTQITDFGARALPHRFYRAVIEP